MKIGSPSAPLSRWRGLSLKKGAPGRAVRGLDQVALPDKVFVSWWVRPEVLERQDWDFWLESHTQVEIDAEVPVEPLPEFVFVASADGTEDAMDV